MGKREKPIQNDNMPVSLSNGRSSHLLTGFYVVLFLFTTFVLLFEFVIPHGGYYVSDPTTTTTTLIITTGSGDAITSSDTETTKTSTLAYPGELANVLKTGNVIGTYETDSLLLTIYQIRVSHSDIYVADVVVSDAHEILTALAYNTFGGTNIVQTVSTMAENHNAIFAVNSDYASHYDTGYVIRNGEILRQSASYRDAIVLYDDGYVDTFAESSVSINTVLDDGAWQLWSFGPVLVKDGLSVADVNDGLDRDRIDNPRTAFGMVDTNHFMFVCVDGRTTESQGVDIEELADIMISIGCTVAYNFDGGGSSTMWFDGSVINVPSQEEERAVSDCVYIAR